MFWDFPTFQCEAVHFRRGIRWPNKSTWVWFSHVFFDFEAYSYTKSSSPPKKSGNSQLTFWRKCSAQLQVRNIFWDLISCPGDCHAWTRFFDGSSWRPATLFGRLDSQSLYMATKYINRYIPGFVHFLFSTIVNLHQTTIWLNMFLLFPSIEHANLCIYIYIHDAYLLNTGTFPTFLGMGIPTINRVNSAGRGWTQQVRIMAGQPTPRATYPPPRNKALLTIGFP